MYGIYLKTTLYPVIKPTLPSLADAKQKMQQVGNWIKEDTLEIAEPSEIEYRRLLESSKAVGR